MTAINETTRTNYCPNPRYIGPDTVSGGTGGEVTQEDLPSGSLDGRGYTAITLSAAQTGNIFAGNDLFDGSALVVGQTYTTSVHMRSPRSGGIDVRLVWIDSGGLQVGQELENNTILAGEWKRLDVSGVMPAGATQYRIVATFQNSLGLLAGDTIDVAQRALVDGPTAGTYFDGGTTWSGLTRYEWTGTPDASTSVEITTIPGTWIAPPQRTNYATNPHAAVDDGASGWSYEESAFGEAATVTFETGTDTPDGRTGYLRAAITTAATSTTGIGYMEYEVREEITDGTFGEYVTASMYYRTSSTAITSITATLELLTGQDAGSVAGSAVGPVVSVFPGQWSRARVMVKASSLFDGARLRVRPNDTADVGDTIDATMVLIERGVGTLGPYFDGDDGGQWTGTPHASTSTLTPAGIPLDLVIDYAHELDTGVTVHEVISGGPPVITRRQDPNLPSGTFMMFCRDQSTAMLVQDICDGADNVQLSSTDVPGAPFVFTPTDRVRARWNTPYESWTVAVPYRRLT